MGVFNPRGRSDSRVSGLPPHSSPSFVDDLAPEHAMTATSPPGAFGIESSANALGGNSYHRTPTRSFYHRSFNNTGMKKEGKKILLVNCHVTDTRPF